MLTVSLVLLLGGLLLLLAVSRIWADPMGEQSDRFGRNQAGSPNEPISLEKLPNGGDPAA